MADKTRKKSRKPVYRHKTNAVHITLYDLSGETLSPVARAEAEEALTQVAFEHNLVINIATT